MLPAAAATEAVGRLPGLRKKLFLPGVRETPNMLHATRT